MTPQDLKALRARLGLSQARLAEILHVHRVTVAKWEAGSLAIPHMAALAIQHLSCRKKA